MNPSSDQAASQLSLPRPNCELNSSAVVEMVLNRARDAMGDNFKLCGVKPRIERHARNFARDLCALRRLGMAGDARAGRAAAYHLLKSHAARFCCVLLSRRKGVVWTWDEIYDIANGMNCRRPSGEHVKVWTEPKASGGRRPLVSFGPKARACQKLVAEILKAWLGDSPFEFSRRGRGRDVAVTNILERIRNGGARWFINGDIRNYFGEIRQTCLYDLLPLPRSVIRNTILIPPETEIRTKDKHPGLETAVRQGIPQGSLASPFVASKVMETVLMDTDCCVAVSFVDNLSIGFKTKAEAMSNYEALARRLSEHPAGPLLLRDDQVFELGQPNSFIGYRLHRRSPSSGGYAYAHPSPEAFSRLDRRLREKLRSAPNDADLEAVGLEYVGCWLLAQRAWERDTYADDNVRLTAEVAAGDEQDRRRDCKRPGPTEETLKQLLAHGN